MGVIASGVSGIESHDFYEGTISGLSPDPQWQFVNRNGGCSYDFVGQGTTNAYLRITIPAGNPPGHDYWSDYGCPLLVQPVTNGNFDVYTSFPTDVGIGQTVYGIMAMDNLTTPAYRNYVGFGYYNGQFHAETGDAQTQSAWSGDVPLGSTPAFPIDLRIARSGNNWSTWYRRATDSGIWQSIDTNVAHTVTVGYIGVFTANFGNEWPGYTQNINYFVQETSDFSGLTTEDTYSSLAGSSRRVFIVT
jgi:hypothetical protein